jgi:hypothetical protein
MLHGMTDEEFKEKFEEIKEEIGEYKRQLDALREDFEILVKCSTQAHMQIWSNANNIGTSGFDQALGVRCRDFAEKYGISLK